MPAPKGNKFALGNHWGRPPEYAHPEDLAAKCLEYFQYCEGEYKEEEYEEYNEETGTTKKGKRQVEVRAPENTTITGLCLFLGFSSRKSFDNQAQRGEEFLHIVERAKMTVAQGYEKDLRSKYFAGATFALKNMGFSDRTEVVSDQTVRMDAHIEGKVNIDYAKLSDNALREIRGLAGPESDRS